MQPVWLKHSLLNGHLVMRTIIVKADLTRAVIPNLQVVEDKSKEVMRLFKIRKKNISFSQNKASQLCVTLEMHRRKCCLITLKCKDLSPALCRPQHWSSAPPVCSSLPSSTSPSWSSSSPCWPWWASLCESPVFSPPIRA